MKIVAGKANSIPMVLDGIPKAIDISLAATSPLAVDPLNAENFTFAGVGPNAAQVLSVQAEDAEQNVIVGPGAPAFAMQSNDPTDVSIAPVAGSPNTFKVTPLHLTSVPIQLTVQATPLGGSGAGDLRAVSAADYAGTLRRQLRNEYDLRVRLVEHVADPHDSRNGGARESVHDEGRRVRESLRCESRRRADGKRQSLSHPAPRCASRTISGLSGPDVGLAIDASGDIFVSEAVGGIDVKEFTPAGGSTPSRTLSSTTSPTGINTPAGLAIDAAGNLYVANNGGSIGVSVFAPGTSTTPLFTFNAGTSKPYYDAFDAAGNCTFRTTAATT